MNSRKQFFSILTSILLAGMFFLLDSNAANVFLKTERSEFQKIPIWVMGFGDRSARENTSTGIGEKITAILKNDLRRTQVFEVVDDSTQGLNFSQTECSGKNQKELAGGSGAAVTTWGKIGRKNNKLVMVACLFDAGNPDEVYGKRYLGQPINDKGQYRFSMRLLREMVHRWTNELVSRYTGDPGIAMTKIVYVSEDVQGKRNLHVMDYDGFGPKRLTANNRLTLMPTWSPDQRSIAYTIYRQNNQEIVQLHWETRLSRLLSKSTVKYYLDSGTKKTLVASKSLNITPEFSSNGQFLAYASASEGNSDIYILDLTTSEKVQLTFHKSADLSPSWSPNNREIAFTSDRGGGPQIYIMSADGTNVRRLTFAGNYNAAPAWSPRGDWIAYVCKLPEFGFKLCRITPHGSEWVRITPGAKNEIHDSPSWSPDGRHLVFSLTRGGSSQIYMVNSDGTGTLEQLTKGGIHYSSPSWSPL